MAYRYRTGFFAFGLLGAFILAETHVTSAEPFATTAAPLAASQPLEILPTGHPVVLVRIDGGAPKRFVIDTAASMTTIMPKLRAQMPDLVARPSVDPIDGAAGQSDVETAIVRQVEVAGHIFPAPTLMLLPPGPTDHLDVDGILGADMIADFVVELDMPGRRWRMTPKVAPGMLEGLLATVPFILDDMRAPRLQIALDGVEVPAILDTGARGTIMNWAAARAIGITPDSPGVVKAADIKGATNHAMPSVEVPITALTIGEATVQGRKVRIADLPIFKVLGFTLEQPAVILGIDMFADRRLVIDHPGLGLHVSPHTALSPNIF